MKAHILESHTETNSCPNSVIDDRNEKEKRVGDIGTGTQTDYLHKDVTTEAPKTVKEVPQEESVNTANCIYQEVVLSVK